MRQCGGNPSVICSLDGHCKLISHEARLSLLLQQQQQQQHIRFQHANLLANDNDNESDRHWEYCKHALFIVFGQRQTGSISIMQLACRSMEVTQGTFFSRASIRIRAYH